MKDAFDITSAVEEAKKDSQSADVLIRKFLPFIKSEVSSFINRSVDEGVDDEYSIAMLAFHEAILSYDQDKGAFIAFAKRVIYSRLIDFTRREKRYSDRRILDGHEDEQSLFETLESTTGVVEEEVKKNSAKEEMQLFIKDLKSYGLSLTEVAENNPKQDRTRGLCQEALAFVKTREDLLQRMVETKKLPLTEIVKETGLSRKTLERHRKYLIAIFLAYTNGFDHIRDHLNQIGGGQ